MILGSNFINGTGKNSTVPIHRTKHVHYIVIDNVSKDFIAKPIILERDGRTESHFTIGSSIGYKTLYKDTTTGNCLNTQGYTTTMEPNTTAGYHKPINELCKDISGGNNNLYQGASIWNNMTKRKSLVKDY